MYEYIFEASVDRDRRQLVPRSELPEQFNLIIFIPATGTTHEKQKKKFSCSVVQLNAKTVKLRTHDAVFACCGQKIAILLKNHETTVLCDFISTAVATIIRKTFGRLS